jgi:hypothetical protein
MGFGPSPLFCAGLALASGPALNESEASKRVGGPAGGRTGHARDAIFLDQCPEALPSSTPRSGMFWSASLKRLVKLAAQMTRVSSTI